MIIFAKYYVFLKSMLVIRVLLILIASVWKPLFLKFPNLQVDCAD